MKISMDYEAKTWEYNGNRASYRHILSEALYSGLEGDIYCNIYFSESPTEYPKDGVSCTSPGPFLKWVTSSKKWVMSPIL